MDGENDGEMQGLQDGTQAGIEAQDGQGSQAQIGSGAPPAPKAPSGNGGNVNANGSGNGKAGGGSKGGGISKGSKAADDYESAIKERDEQIAKLQAQINEAGNNLGERMAAVEDAAGYASDQSTSNTEVAAAQELNIEELQNAVAVRPTATEMNAAIADSKAALDDLGGMEF